MTPPIPRHTPSPWFTTSMHVINGGVPSGSLGSPGSATPTPTTTGGAWFGYTGSGLPHGSTSYHSLSTDTITLGSGLQVRTSTDGRVRRFSVQASDLQPTLTFSSGSGNGGSPPPVLARFDVLPQISRGESGQAEPHSTLPTFRVLAAANATLTPEEQNHDIGFRMDIFNRTHQDLGAQYYNSPIIDLNSPREFLSDPVHASTILSEAGVNFTAQFYPGVHQGRNRGRGALRRISVDVTRPGVYQFNGHTYVVNDGQNRTFNFSQNGQPRQITVGAGQNGVYTWAPENGNNSGRFTFVANLTTRPATTAAAPATSSPPDPQMLTITALRAVSPTRRSSTVGDEIFRNNNALSQAITIQFNRVTSSDFTTQNQRDARAFLSLYSMGQSPSTSELINRVLIPPVRTLMSRLSQSSNFQVALLREISGSTTAAIASRRLLGEQITAALSNPDQFLNNNPDTALVLYPLIFRAMYRGLPPLAP